MESEFPPREVKEFVEEAAALLKERGESVGVAETVSWSVKFL